MIQTVICKIPQCPFRSESGYCLNRLTIVNENGVCQHLTRPDWQNAIDKKYMNNYRPPVNQIEDNAGVGDNQEGSEVEEERGTTA